MSAALATTVMSPDVPDAASQLASLPFPALLTDPEGRVADANPAAEVMIGRSRQRLFGVSLAEVAGCAEADRSTTSVAGYPGWHITTLATADRIRDDTAVGSELRTPAILAHEIKNPLAAIRGAGQLLARRVEPRDKPLTTIIAAEVDRIAALIDRMQQLGSAPVSGRGPSNLHQAIRSALASVRAVRGSGVAFVERFDPSLPPVAIDAGVLEQMLINLLTNACDACAGVSDPQVTIQTRYVGGAQRSLPVEIAVIDNGPGVAAEIAEHIFEPFVTGKPQGQGLGLALVRKLARDMGARVTHDRDGGAGLTSFRIGLAVAT